MEQKHWNKLDNLEKRLDRIIRLLEALVDCHIGFEQAIETERKRWAAWIGGVLPVKHPESKVLLWGIAEAIERNNFGVVPSPQAVGEGE